jgi:hypothetical protein
MGNIPIVTNKAIQNPVRAFQRCIVVNLS